MAHRAQSFAEGALAQGLPSLLNFVAALWLVREAGLEAFGFYSFLFAISAMISAVQRPLVSLPMSVFAARSHVADHYADFFVFHLVALGIGGVVALGIGAAFEVPTFAFVAYALGQQGREFVKSYLFSVQARREAMRIELVASAVFLASMSVLHVLGRIDVGGVLAAGAAGTIAFVVPWYRARRSLALARRRRFRWRRYRYIWRFARWSVAGALANEVATRSYNYIIALLGGFQLLGLINFVRQLFAPIQLLSHAWSQISLPVMREHYAAARAEAARRLRLLARGGFAVATLVWAAVLYLAVPLMHRWREELDAPQLPLLLALWCLYYLIDSQLSLYAVEFHLGRRFRFLFMTGFAAAVATLALSLPVVMWLPEPWLVAVSAALNACLLYTYRRALAGDRTVERPTPG